MQTRAHRHLRALKLAMDCAALGARIRSIHHMTGLPARDLQRLLFNDPMRIPRGRAPDSPEWYHSANLLYRTDASVFAAVYRRTRHGGFAAGDALVGAYRCYQLTAHPPHRISFDRAFDLASHLDGIWVARTSSFDVVTCPQCAGDFLAALGTVARSQDCPFCKLVSRYPRDPRLQSSFPTQPLPDPQTCQRATLALVWSNGQRTGQDAPPSGPSIGHDGSAMAPLP